MKQKLELKNHHMMALRFLRDEPGHDVGIIDTKEKLAAAVVISELIQAGYAVGTLLPGYGGIRLSEQGALAVFDDGALQ